MRILVKAVAAGLMLPWATSAQAAEAPRSNWQFSTTMYVWVSDLEGNLRTAGPVEPVDVDLSYGKVLKHLKFAGMGALQARKDRLIFLADLSYVHLGADSGIGIRDDDLVEADLDAATFTGSLLGGYRVAEGKVDVDLLAGGRLVVTDTDLVLSGPLRTVEGDVTESWVDPILGAHVGIPIGAKTTLGMYGDIGGFGVGSDFTWQTVIGVQHRIGSNWQLSAGWRHYAVDYDKGQFLYDVKQSGPIIGARFDF